MEKPVRRTQIVINTTDLPFAVRIAGEAIQGGVDAVMLGLPLIYTHGLHAIDAVREVARNVPLAVDLRIHDGCYLFFAAARKHGADSATVAAVSNYSGCREAVRAKHDLGMAVTADLNCMDLATLARQALEVEATGVDAICVSAGHDQSKYDPLRQSYDGVREVSEAVSIPVICRVDSSDAAVVALQRGARWIAFDLAGEATDPRATIGRYVELAHNFAARI
jgi:3-hexulose-6-phosphate synthase/6-phospho-3-hexuloisomerase